MTNSPIAKISSSQLKMANKSQKRKDVAELASRDSEASTAENNQTENHVAGPSKSPKIQSEKLNEIKTSLRKRSCLV